MGKKGRVQLGKALEMMGKVKGRRDAKRLIGSGRVIVMGMVANSAAMKVELESMEKEVQVLEAEAGEAKEVQEGSSKRQKIERKEKDDTKIEKDDTHQFCVAYNKPCGMECTCAEGEGGTKTLLDIQPSLPSFHYKAVGRLGEN